MRGLTRGCTGARAANFFEHPAASRAPAELGVSYLNPGAKMEGLKKFEEVILPDEGQKAFVVVNHSSQQHRPLTIRDVYQNVSDIRLHDGVPEVVRSHFATAQNLLVYSWFSYPFNVTAQFLGELYT